MKANLPFIIIIAVILIVDVVGGYIIGRKVLVPYSYEREMTVGASEGEDVAEGAQGSEEPGIVHPLEPINMNPASSAGEVFSVSMSLVTHDELLVTELTSREPQIIDIILTYLSAKTIPELNDVARRQEYRKEIIDRINAVLTTGKISGLYVSQWIIQ